MSQAPIDRADSMRSVPIQLASKSIRFTTPPPLSLYIHLPWCLKKCPYCDFNSHEWRAPAGGADPLPEAAYLNALQLDLEAALPSVWGRKIISVFIGGGTPSLFSAASIDRLLTMVRTLLPLNADAEITMEANPGTFEADKFAAFAASGVNRLSIGVQSFDPKHLKLLGRVHSAEQAIAAIDTARRCFPNFNLDVMYGLPEQSLSEARADIERALSFDPPHLSLYHLTLEPNTYFSRYPPKLPDDDTAAEMQEWISQRMAAAGYDRYEVSAYCKPQCQSRHNLNYWRFGDYLGIGAGAHSKLSFHDRIVRQVRHKQPAAYLRAAQTGEWLQEGRSVRIEELPFEFMLNALRLREGVPTSLFAEHAGVSVTQLRKGIDEARRKGLLADDPTVIQATPLGWRFLNDLQAVFLTD